VNPFEKYRERCVHHPAPGEALGELDLELLQWCFEYARNTGEPLSPELLHELIFEIRILRSGSVRFHVK
jgi:hypothetical protein